MHYVFCLSYRMFFSDRENLTICLCLPQKVWISLSIFEETGETDGNHLYRPSLPGYHTNPFCVTEYH